MSSSLSIGGQLLSNAVGPLAESLIAGNAGPFRTTPVKALPPALYAIALRGPSPPYLPLFLYTFPISPYNMRKDVTALSNFYDVQGSATSFGVSRVPDTYGQSPPVWNIEGTTGVKYHSNDRFLFTGLESILILQGVLAQYASLNAAQAQTFNTKLYRLEFYDYFTSDFWQIIPIGPQVISQDAMRPQLVRYRLRFAGIQSLSQPIADLVDPVLQTLTQPVDAAAGSLYTDVSNFVSTYTGISL